MLGTDFLATTPGLQPVTQKWWFLLHAREGNEKIVAAGWNTCRTFHELSSIDILKTFQKLTTCGKWLQTRPGKISEQTLHKREKRHKQRDPTSFVVIWKLQTKTTMHHSTSSKGAPLGWECDKAVVWTLATLRIPYESAWFKSQALCFLASFLIMHSLGRSRWWLKHLGAYHPCEIPKEGSGLSASVWLMWISGWKTSFCHISPN